MSTPEWIVLAVVAFVLWLRWMDRRMARAAAQREAAWQAEQAANRHEEKVRAQREMEARWAAEEARVQAEHTRAVDALIAAAIAEFEKKGAA